MTKRDAMGNATSARKKSRRRYTKRNGEQRDLPAVTSLLSEVGPRGQMWFWTVRMKNSTYPTTLSTRVMIFTSTLKNLRNLIFENGSGLKGDEPFASNPFVSKRLEVGRAFIQYRTA